MKIKNKLLLAILGIGILPLIGAVSVISYSISEQINDALYKQASEKLTAVREMRREQINDYFTQLKTIVASMANSANTAAAVRDFSNGFDPSAEPDAADLQSIQSYYQQDFLTQYKKLDPAVRDSDIKGLVDKSDQSTLFYQALYLE